MREVLLTVNECAMAIAAICGAIVGVCQLIRMKNKKDAEEKIEQESEDERVGKNLDQYKLSGDENLYGKGRLVLAVVKKYVSQNPGSTVEALKNIFPDEWQGRYVVSGEDDSVWQDKKRFEHDFFWRQDEMLMLDDGKRAAVCRQWGVGNIYNFIDGIKKYGFTVEAIKRK